ncbi:MAG: S41 family peptidase [Dysgonamonadaceae bacterium]|jgi:hypothetical protein|nr:S41 family peptidase [Dysgonamonadaceae bacterium]
MKISKIKLSLFALPIFLLMAATSCSDNLTSFNNDAEGNFDALWTILDRNYCFFEYKNIDWDSVYEEYRPRIANDMGTDALFDVMGMMLAALQDGHVNLIAAHDVSRYWEWKDDYPENFDLSVQKAYLKTDYSIAGGLEYKILEDNVGYIYYGSFSGTATESALNQILSRMAICHGIIIDVRGNGGGSLDNVDRIAGRFFNEKTHIGYISHKTGWGHNDFSELYPRYINSSDNIRYQKPVVVLTNRSCYSATNEFVSVMKYAPNATILGDRTGGGSGLPFSSELPNGWSVRFSASPLFNAEKEQIEFGIDPDVKVELKDGDVARKIDTLIEAARSLIKEKADNYK